MVASAVKPKWDPSECFYSGLHLILECRDTKLWSIVGCIIIMSDPEVQSQQTVKQNEVPSHASTECVASRLLEEKSRAA
jgi:hypothetical protein